MEDKEYEEAFNAADCLRKKYKTKNGKPCKDEVSRLLHGFYNFSQDPLNFHGRLHNCILYGFFFVRTENWMKNRRFNFGACLTGPRHLGYVLDAAAKWSPSVFTFDDLIIFMRGFGLEFSADEECIIRRLYDIEVKRWPTYLRDKSIGSISVEDVFGAFLKGKYFNSVITLIGDSKVQLGGENSSNMSICTISSVPAASTVENVKFTSSDLNVCQNSDYLVKNTLHCSFMSNSLNNNTDSEIYESVNYDEPVGLKTGVSEGSYESKSFSDFVKRDLEIDEGGISVNSKDFRISREFVIKKTRVDNEIITKDNIAHESTTSVACFKIQQMPMSCHCGPRNGDAGSCIFVASEDEKEALATGIYNTPIESTASSQEISDLREDISRLRQDIANLSNGREEFERRVFERFFNLQKFMVDFMLKVSDNCGKNDNVINVVSQRENNRDENKSALISENHVELVLRNPITSTISTIKLNSDTVMPISSSIKDEDVIFPNSTTMSESTTASKDITTLLSTIAFNDDTAKIPNFLYRLSKKFKNSFFTIRLAQSRLSVKGKDELTLERVKNNMKDLIASGECREIDSEIFGTNYYIVTKPCNKNTNKSTTKDIIDDLQLFYEKLVRGFFIKGKLWFTPGEVRRRYFIREYRLSLDEVKARLDLLVAANKLFMYSSSKCRFKYGFKQQLSRLYP